MEIQAKIKNQNGFWEPVSLFVYNGGYDLGDVFVLPDGSEITFPDHRLQASNLEDKIADLESKVSDLEWDVSKLESKVSDLEWDVSKLERK